LLEGDALATWLELIAEQQAIYADAKTRILERLAPVQFNDFHCRHLIPGESLPLFVHELKKLMEQAMSKANFPARQQLLILQFLTDVVSKQLRATEDIDDLDKLIQHTKLLITIGAQGT